MHVLDANGAAVRVLEARDDLAQRQLAGAEVAGDEGLVEVGFAEAEVLRIELGRRRLQHAQRVEVGEEMAADAVGVDQLGDAFLQLFGLEAFDFRRGDVEEGAGEMAVVAVSGHGDDRRGRLRPGARLERRRAGEGQPVHAGEVLLPLLVDGRRVLPPALVLILDEDLVDSEIAVEIHRARKNSRSSGSEPWNVIVSAVPGEWRNWCTRQT